MKELAAAIALLCLSTTVLAHDIYSNLRDRDGISVVEDRTVSQSRLQCCGMAITIYHRLKKSSLRIWQHHHLMIVSTIAPILHGHMQLIPTLDHGKASPKLDAFLLQCTLRDPP